MQPDLLDPKTDNSEDFELWGREMAESLNSAENNVGKKQDNGINDSLSSQEGQAGKQPWDTSEVSKGIGKSPIGVQSIKALLKGKKKAAIALASGGGTIGIVGIIIFLASSLSIINLKEVFTQDLNDQVAAMDIRSGHMFRVKLKGMSKGLCTNKISVKCKFATMSKKQVKKFEKAGFTDIETDDRFGGRKKITSLTAPDGTKISNPVDLEGLRRTSPSMRAAMNRVYNPLFFGFYDKTAGKVFKKFKTNKSKKVSGKDEKERKKSLADATQGEKADSSPMKDADGKEYVTDEEGNKVYDDDNPDKFKEISEANEKKSDVLKSKTKSGGGKTVKAVTETMKGVGRGVSVLGIADSACGVYTTVRAVSAAAKIFRSIQLTQFAMVILTTADSIKAGEVTSEEAEFIGDMLTKTDTRETIPDETNITGDVKNPFYGKSAFDSPGYNIAAYNTAPTLTAQSQQYMIGGGLTGKYDAVVDQAVSLIGGRAAAKATCKVIQSPVVRFGGLVLGVLFGAATFGAGTVASMAGSGVVAAAIPFLESFLADIMAGTVVSEDIAGVEAGDAAFAGTAALQGGMAQARGMQPLNKENMQSYFAVTNEVKTNIAAAEKYEARSTPFDIENQYSFLGSALRTLNPSSVKIKNGGANTISGISSLLSTAISTVLPSVDASRVYNEERFSKCNDLGYQDTNIDADVFCNVRYGLTDSELNMDPEEVVDYMVANNYINEESGEPVEDSDYKKFVDNCVDRADGWGEASEEGGSIGLECIDGHKETFKDISYFRVYTMDSSINDGMEDEEEPTSSESSEAVMGNVGISTSGWGYPTRSPSSACGFDCYSGHVGMDIQQVGGQKIQIGEPLHAMRDGEVIATGDDVATGEPDAVSESYCKTYLEPKVGPAWQGVPSQIVKLKHVVDGTDVYVRYSHLKTGSIKVKVGDKVKAGQVLAEVGLTGCTTGTHAHITVSKNRAGANPIDPTTLVGRSW